MKRIYIVFGIVLVLFLAAYAVYAGFLSRKIELAVPARGDAKVVGPIFQPPPSVRPDGFLEYKNLILRFSLFYPDDLVVTEYDDGTSASTIIFKSKVGTSGFQIFVVPYALDYVTPEQFKKDSPSGIMMEPVDVLIDGSKATVFYGQDSVLGETREVWFIKNGFLYEISTFKHMDSWLADIMKTWKFM